jgi:hypothetical protein
MVAGLLTIGLARADADVIYSYTGPDFTEFVGVYACPDVCRVTGSFAVAEALPASTHIDPVAPTWFSFTDGTHVFDSTTVEEVFSFLIRTDDQGLPEAWDITFEINTLPKAMGTMWGTLERDISNQTAVQGLQPGGSAACYNCRPGTWTVRTDDDPPPVPEPAVLLLFGAAGLGSARRLRRYFRA